MIHTLLILIRLLKGQIITYDDIKVSDQEMFEEFI